MIAQGATLGRLWKRMPALKGRHKNPVIISPLQGLGNNFNSPQGCTLGYYICVPLGLYSEVHFLDLYTQPH